MKQKPKIIEAVTTDKEHVNVVFIGHVGKKLGAFYLFVLETACIQGWQPHFFWEGGG